MSCDYFFLDFRDISGLSPFFFDKRQIGVYIPTPLRQYRPGILGFEIADSCGFKRGSGVNFAVAWLTNSSICWYSDLSPLVQGL